MQEAVGAREAAVRVAAAQERDRYLEAGVQERRSLTWAELVASWKQACDTAGDRLEPVTGDAVVHLLDIDAALGIMADEAPHVLAAGLRAVHQVQRTHLRAVGLPPVHVAGVRPGARARSTRGVGVGHRREQLAAAFRGGSRNPS